MGPAPMMTTKCLCLFGVPVKVARLEEKGKHHTALSASLLAWRLAWQSPKGHMFALLKVSAALGSLGTSDRTPTAAGRQAHPSARSHVGQAGRSGRPGCGHCWPRSGRDNPQPRCSSVSSLCGQLSYRLSPHPGPT